MSAPPPPPPAAAAVTKKKTWKVEVKQEEELPWQTRYPIHAAANEGRLDDLRTLLADDAQKGKLYDDDGWTALHYASWYDQVGSVQLLLEMCGNDTVHLKTTASQSTPLHYAAGTGRAQVVRLLMNAGADAQVKDKEGNTPLQLAKAMKENQWQEVVDILTQ
jgi:ankyrin repeat protein